MFWSFILANFCAIVMLSTILLLFSFAVSNEFPKNILIQANVTNPKPISIAFYSQFAVKMMRLKRKQLWIGKSLKASNMLAYVSFTP